MAQISWKVVLSSGISLLMAGRSVCASLEVKLGETGHQHGNVLVSLAHFVLVLGVLLLVVVHLAATLYLHPLHVLIVLAAPGHKFVPFEFALFELLLVVLAQNCDFLLRSLHFFLAAHVAHLVSLQATHRPLTLHLSGASLNQVCLALLKLFLVNFEAVLCGLTRKFLLAKGVGLLLGLCVCCDQLLLQRCDTSIHLRVLLGGPLLFSAGSLLQPIDLAGVTLSLRAQHLLMLAVSLALGSAGQLLLVFKNSIILFDLTDLLLQRLNQHVSVFDILFRSVLFRCGLVGLSLLPLTAQLKFLQFLSLRLVTEISPLQVRLELPLGSRSFFAVARKLNELLVLLVLDEITLTSQLRVVGE